MGISGQIFPGKFFGKEGLPEIFEIPEMGKSRAVAHGRG
jgi:hypothetical protein